MTARQFDEMFETVRSHSSTSRPRYFMTARQFDEMFETALGPRFRRLIPYKQEVVMGAVGCSSIEVCPLALAYGIEARGSWNLLSPEDRATLHAAGVQQAAYEAFIAVNDSDNDDWLALLRGWMRRQQEETP